MAQEDLKEPTEVVVTRERDWSACLEHLSRTAVIGLDTEFVGEGRYQPDLCLVQIATPETLYVIDPFALGRLDPLWELLQDPQRVVVVHGGKEDIRICQRQGGRPPGRIFDTQIAAALVGPIYPIGYARLTMELFGVSPNKDLTMSNWRRRPLMQAQLRYAFDDVRYLLPAYQRLHELLQRYQRQDWAEEEFALLIERALAEDVERGESWRRIKGIGRLNRQGLAVLREVYTWREEYSRELNRPARQVLSDHVLVRIARLQPQSVRELAFLRGVPQNAVADIFDAVQRALAMPPLALPTPAHRVPDTSRLSAISHFLQIVLHDWCARQQIAVPLAATAADLKAFAYNQLSEQENLDLPLYRGWRARVLLPELQAALKGHRLIAIDLQATGRSPLRVVPHEAITISPPPAPVQPAVETTLSPHPLTTNDGQNDARVAAGPPPALKDPSPLP